MIPQSAVPASVKKQFSPVDCGGEVTPAPAETSDGVSETTGTAVRVTKFDLAHYRHENEFPRVIQVNFPEIALRGIVGAHDINLVQSIP